MIRWSALFFAFCLAGAAFAQVSLPANHRSPTPKAGQVIGKAFGKSITASDVEPFLWDWYGKQALYDVLSYVVITQDAQKHGVSVTDAEVEKAIDSEMKTVQKNQSSDPSDALLDQGFTRSRLYLRTKATLLLDKIVMTQFHPRDFVKVSTILIRTSSTDASVIANAIKQCQSAYDQLMKGGDWDKVMMSVVTDTKLVQTRGALGWRSLTLFPESVQKEISSLPVGGITHPAQTQFGIQLFRIDARGADAKGDDLTALKNSYLIGERAKYMDDLKQRANAQALLK